MRDLIGVAILGMLVGFAIGMLLAAYFYKDEKISELEREKIDWKYDAKNK